MRILAIGLMCAAMICFTGPDTCAKWLSASLPTAQIVWARYVGAALIALVASRPLSRPSMLRSNAPSAPAVALRFALRLDRRNVSPLRELQLSETATISFLTPIFVALLAGPVLGERVGAERADRHRDRISWRSDCYAARSRCVSADRARRGRRRRLQFGLRARDPQTRGGGLPPQTTLAWTQIAGIVFLTPMLPWIWRQPRSAIELGDHGGHGRFRGHQPRTADRRPSVCPSADLDPVHLHSAHLDDRFRRSRFWRLAVGRDIDRRLPGRGVRRLSRASREAGAAASKPGIDVD